MSDDPATDTEFHAFWRSVIVRDLDDDIPVSDSDRLPIGWSVWGIVAVSTAIWFAIWSVF